MSLRNFLLAATTLLAACSSPAEVAERTGVQPSEAAGVSASAGASGAKDVVVSEETSLFHFGIAYPASVTAIPALSARLEAEARRVQAEMTAEAEASRADALANDYSYNPHSYGAKWQIVADVPGFLSLSNAFSTYSGGAHGMYGAEGFVWDKAKSRGFASSDLFQSPQALDAAMGNALCAALQRERRERRGDETVGGMFLDCPGLEEATILVGSSNGRTFDRITVYYGPYVAGSYAEGPYELDFPVTSAMLNAVKPSYREAFSAQR